MHRRRAAQKNHLIADHLKSTQNHRAAFRIVPGHFRLIQEPVEDFFFRTLEAFQFRSVDDGGAGRRPRLAAWCRPPRPSSLDLVRCAFAVRPMEPGP